MLARLLPPFFLSIVIIEAVILIPSYHNYERDLLLRLEQVGRASIVSAFLAHETPNDNILDPFQPKISTCMGWEQCPPNAHLMTT